MVITLCLLTFVISIMGVIPYIKTVTDQVKFTYIAKEYKSNYEFENKISKKDLKTKKEKVKDDKISLDTQVTLNLFENLKYDLDNIRLGETVKPVYLSKLPKDLAKIKSTTKKKETFIKIVLPLVLDENNKILENRKKLFKILSKQVNSMGEKRWLKRRFEQYGIKNEDTTELKLRMDIIPPSLALAQAAKESGWGTSRFALQGNAMFGQWTWGDNGIEPSGKSDSQDHKILRFPMLRSSVVAYQNNLSTHKGYSDFREMRAELRKDNKNISGLELANYLHNYAATGTEYIKTLKKIIKQNELTDFDKSILMNSPQSSSLIL